ncbi:transcriptional regulator [Sulfolobus sp. S-194]|uniref:ArsR/SmtB family transcription factor n=1 Tax=Sulfolobus sp. S-194 TaxID=2512240 RepID=UPI001436DC70|nr:helix-turn-helix domain-containing protein [Sulfolobus sp. S-194]QIW23871.1 transcriptional regulator [Sulfolobus sp. S-194]
MSNNDKIYIYILLVLYVYGPMSFTDLYYKLDSFEIKTTKGNLQHHLNKLKEEGLVDRKYLPAFLTKKKVVYKITDKGVQNLIDLVHEMKRIESLINNRADDYKTIYFPDEELWERMLKEAEDRKISIYQLLKEAFEHYMKSKSSANERVKES